MGLSRWLETPEQTAERKADEARQRREDREVEAILAKRDSAWWRHWAES